MTDKTKEVDYDKWEFTNQWRPSTRKSNHARHIRVWRLK
jgi:hypothetical protein